MKSLLIRIFLAVAVIIGIVAFIGSMLPRDFDFETTANINAPPQMVFPYFNDLENWDDWSMWSPDRIEGLEIQLSGETEGVEAVQTWTEARGKGKMWIIKSVPDSMVEYKSEFLNFPTMDSKLELAPSGMGATTVTWSSKGKLPSGPFYGYFGSLFSEGMKSEYDQALARLKELVE